MNLRVGSNVIRSRMEDLSALVATIVDSPDGFGPSAIHRIPKYADIPYAPFSKNDQLGKVVDWNGEASSSSAQIQFNAQPRRTGAQPTAGKYGRESKEAFGAGSAGTFAYFHDEDEASFSLVDGSKSGALKRGAGAGGSSGGLNNLGRTSQYPRNATGDRKSVV